MRKLNILLVAGGWSPEREVSLHGAGVMAEALRGLGHQVTCFDLGCGLSDLLEQAVRHEFALINLHGAPGEDGLVQALLERAGCPYQGSGPAGSFLALHKAAAKVLFERDGIVTPRWIFLPRPPARDWRPALPYPLFVKANTGGSSLNAFKADGWEDLSAILDKLFAAGEEVLLEELIRGRELTCGVLEDKDGAMLALPPVLIVPRGGAFFDYANKYAADGAQELCPAPIAGDISRRARETAARAHRLLGLRGYSRSDFLLDENDALYLLEVNTLPGMTKTSLLPKEAAALGISFGELLERLILAGLGAE